MPTSIPNRFLASKSIFLGLILNLALCSSAHSQPGAASRVAAVGSGLTVRVDPRIELLAIIYRLAGYNEFKQGRIEQYSRDVDEHFNAFSDHPVIAHMQRARRERAVAYNSAMALAVHITDDGAWRPLGDFADPEHQLYQDNKWNPDLATRALELIRDFAVQSDFEGFFTRHRDLNELAATRMREMLATHFHQEWYERFFGVEPSAPFSVCIGLLNGPANYAARHRDPDGTEHLYAILGAWLRDDEGLPRFDASVTSTLIHEFNHSFANPLIDAFAAQLQEAGQAIFVPLEPHMSRLAYGRWQIMFYESLVRACVIRYQLRYSGSRTARAELLEQENQDRFIWTGGLVDLLHEYEVSRDRYPTLRDFMPRLVTFFSELGDKIDEFVEDFETRYENGRPRVVTSSIPADEGLVDSGVTEITFRFNRPMESSHAITIDPDKGKEQFPEIGDVSWDATSTLLTIQVKLAANHHYRFALESTRNGGFRSTEDIALATFPVRFSTGP